MRINCTIDDTSYNFNVNTDKPLSLILEEKLDTFKSNNKCLGAGCGNCIVLVNGACTLSCLVPAFKINKAKILTYEGFSKTRNCHDIERAYNETGIKPCRQCYASKTLLIESLLQRLDEQNEQEQSGVIRKNVTMIDSEIIDKELEINACKCLDSTQITRVLVVAHQNRSKRRGKV